MTQKDNFKQTINIQRGSQKNCEVCKKKFSLVIRQHQCKRCLKAVCSQCGNYKKNVYSENFTIKMDRICETCRSSSEYISNLIKINNVKFGQMSDIGSKWIKKITKKSVAYGTDKSKHQLLTKQKFKQLWKNYSFQLRQLIGLLTFAYQQDGIYDVVYNVYTTIISAFPEYSLDNIINLIMFVLCFCSADKAALLIMFLLQMYKSENDLKQKINKYINSLAFGKIEIYSLQKYILYRLDKFSTSFFVNCFTIQVLISLITKILDKKNINQLLMFFCCHIFINKDLIQIKNNIGEDTVNLLILRNCNYQSIIPIFKMFKNKDLFADYPDLNKNNKSQINFQQSFSLSPNKQVIKVNFNKRNSLIFDQNSQNNQSSSINSFSVEQNQLKIQGFQVQKQNQIQRISYRQNSLNNSPFRKTIQSDIEVESNQIYSMDNLPLQLKHNSLNTRYSSICFQCQYTNQQNQNNKKLIQRYKKQIQEHKQKQKKYLFQRQQQDKIIIQQKQRIQQLQKQLQIQKQKIQIINIQPKEQLITTQKNQNDTKIEYIQKIQQLSNLLMQIQQQKLQIAQQNFLLHQILKANNIKF